MEGGDIRESDIIRKVWNDESMEVYRRALLDCKRVLKKTTVSDERKGQLLAHIQTEIEGVSQLVDEHHEIKRSVTDMPNNKYFDFDLPEQLLAIIEEYKDDKNPLNRDLYQDEIRSLARYLENEEQEESVIEYFCRKAKCP